MEVTLTHTAAVPNQLSRRRPHAAQFEPLPTPDNSHRAHADRYDAAQGTWKAAEANAARRAFVGAVVGVPMAVAVYTLLSASSSHHSMRVAQVNPCATGVGTRAYLGAVSGAIVGIFWPILPDLPNNIRANRMSVVAAGSLTFACGICIGMALHILLYEVLPVALRPGDPMVYNL